MGTAEPRSRYLAGLIEALGLELVAARSSGSSPIMIEGGQRLDTDGIGATYRFSLLYDSALPEGVPVRFEVNGRRWDAEVLQREGLSLLVLVRRDKQGELPAAVVPSALLFAEPWYLIELLQAAVSDLAASQTHTGPTDDLLDLLVGRKHPGASGSNSIAASDLNREQVEAVVACTSSPVWFVWGPPGTGKTTTLGYVVKQSVEQGERVLVTAHSNVAVDAALLAALKADPDGLLLRTAVRAGPAVLPAARQSGRSTRELALARDPKLRQRYEEVSQQLASSAGNPLGTLLEKWRSTMQDLRKAEDDLIERGGLVFATLSKLVASDALAGRAFDVAIVDEVSMSYPAQVVVAAAHARSRVNVFGDCRQLPPIVLSESVVARERLGRDVFTACGADHPGASGVTMLKEQFRMHPQIRKVVSDFAYGGALRDAPGIEAEREPIARRAPLPGHAVAWLDVGPLGATRFFDRHHGSRFNPISALCCIRAAMELDGERAVILTPYRTQARLLGALVNDAAMAHVEVGTIHRYQGSEAPTVIVDLVDGSGTKVGQPFKGQGGERLLNVGLSRAQGKVIVVGNGTMPTQDLTRRSIAALASVRHHHKAPPSTPWSGTGEHGFAMSMQRGIPAPAPVDPAGVVAAWLPDELPVELRWLQGPHADRWEGGHPSWLGPGGSFGVFAVRPGGVVSITLAGAARFAEAMSDAITGSPLTRRPALDRATGKAPPKASRHDQCGRCGARAVPAAATRYRIELECVACHGVRQATDREVSAWMREVGPRCPHCGRGMRLISGPRAPYGPFLGCSGYPDCDGKMPLDAVLDAVDHPDPPPPEEPPRKSSRRRTAASTVSELDRRTCPSCFLSLPSTLFDPGSELCRDCS